MYYPIYSTVIQQGANNDIIDNRNGLNMEQCPAYEITKVTHTQPPRTHTYPSSL